MKRKSSTAKAAAWKWLSEYVRRKGADEHGYTQCVTCGVRKHWKEMDAGHFIPKKRGLAIYFVEVAIHPQCTYCNRFNGGMLIEYTLYMQEMYGPNVVDDLLRLSRTTVRMRLADFEAIENEYKEKCRGFGCEG